MLYQEPREKTSCCVFDSYQLYCDSHFLNLYIYSSYHSLSVEDAASSLVRGFWLAYDIAHRSTEIFPYTHKIVLLIFIRMYRETKGECYKSQIIHHISWNLILFPSSQCPPGAPSEARPALANTPGVEHKLRPRGSTASLQGHHQGHCLYPCQLQAGEARGVCVGSFCL